MAGDAVVVDDVEVTEDDVLLPVAGILDVLENYAFIRTSGYLPGPNDVYVSLAQVKKYNLRKGDAVVGAIRAPREGESQQGGQQQALHGREACVMNSRRSAASWRRLSGPRYGMWPDS